MRNIALLLIGGLLSAGLAVAAQDPRGLARQLLGEPGAAPTLYRASHALLIGNHDYQDWPDLPQVSRELQALAPVLEAQGFTVEFAWDLDSDALRARLKEFLMRHGGGEGQRDNRLLVFYSGHGATRTGFDGKQLGYIVPVDAPAQQDEAGFVGKALNMDDLVTWSREIGAKHLLFLFDSCFSGSVLQAQRSTESLPEHIQASIQNPVRQFLTAGASGETVPAESAFTPALIRGLRDGAADLSRDGYITGNELALYLAQEVPKYTQPPNHPQAGRFGNGHDLEGDVVFGNPAWQAVAPADDTEQLFWQVVQQERSAAFYQKYLERYPNGVHREEALQALRPAGAAEADTLYDGDGMARQWTEQADTLYFQRGNYPAAFRLYQQAAERGNASAMASLAKLWALGIGTGSGKDIGQARQWRDKALPTVKRLAEGGEAFAQYQLGNLYEVVDEDYAKALAWYRKAAEQGHAVAQNNLGWMYENGKGVAQDDREAVAWYRKAAEQGHAVAQNNLGWMYQNGKGVAQDDQEALNWYRKSAEQGNAAAQNNIGMMYQNGKGVAQDDREAVTWYRKSVEQNDPWAQNNLGWMYHNGLGVAQDDQEAMFWYRKAAKEGVAEAQNNIGWMYENGKGVAQDYREAMSWFLKATEQSNAAAQNNIGWMYQNGEGVTQDDKEAVFWYRKAAEQGNVDAQYNLGWMYEIGKGVVQDEREAVTWYRKAADQGFAKAQSNLGWMYLNGKGVEHNDQKAVVWFRMAAEQGNGAGQNNLGWMYEKGKGVTQDDQVAVTWYRRAATQGYAEAKENLRRLGIKP